MMVRVFPRDNDNDRRARHITRWESGDLDLALSSIEHVYVFVFQKPIQRRAMKDLGDKWV